MFDIFSNFYSDLERKTGQREAKKVSFSHPEQLDIEHPLYPSFVSQKCNPQKDMTQCNAEIEECKSTTAHHKGIIWNVRKVDQYSGYFSHPEIFGSARVGVISATIHTYSGFMICTTLILAQSEIVQRSGLRGTVMGSSKGRAEGWEGWAAYQGLGGWPCQLKYGITIYFPSPILSNFERCIKSEASNQAVCNWILFKFL